MANEEKKDFNAMLHRANGMPKVQLVTDEATVKKYGGTRMYFAPPLACLLYTSDAADEL